MSEQAVKFCTRCGEAKPLYDMVRESRNPDGVRALCKACKRTERSGQLWKHGGPRRHLNQIALGDRSCVTVSQSRCTVCGETKTQDRFSLDKRRKTGLMSKCRDCDNNRRRGVRGTRVCIACGEAKAIECYVGNVTICAVCDAPAREARKITKRARKRQYDRQRERSARMMRRVHCSDCGWEAHPAEMKWRNKQPRCHTCDGAYVHAVIASETKECTTCHEVRSKAYFQRDKKALDGLLGSCRFCRSIWEATRQQTEDRKIKAREYKRRSRTIDPSKQAAWAAVADALRDGRLIQQPCEVCGNEESEAHHDDYAHRLKVRWLCFKHHREHHGQVVISERTSRDRW